MLPEMRYHSPAAFHALAASHKPAAFRVPAPTDRFRRKRDAMPSPQLSAPRRGRMATNAHSLRCRHNPRKTRHQGRKSASQQINRAVNQRSDKPGTQGRLAWSIVHDT